MRYLPFLLLYSWSAATRGRVQGRASAAPFSLLLLAASSSSFASASQHGTLDATCASSTECSSGQFCHCEPTSATRRRMQKEQREARAKKYRRRSSHKGKQSPFLLELSKFSKEKLPQELHKRKVTSKKTAPARSQHGRRLFGASGARGSASNRPIDTVQCRCTWS